jgi:hypothetical protein
MAAPERKNPLGQRREGVIDAKRNSFYYRFISAPSRAHADVSDCESPVDESESEAEKRRISNMHNEHIFRVVNMRYSVP